MGRGGHRDRRPSSTVLVRDGGIVQEDQEQAVRLHPGETEATGWRVGAVADAVSQPPQEELPFVVRERPWERAEPFEETVLESILADVKASHLVIAGAETDACIRSTLHGAFVSGYDVTLVGDAHTTSDYSEWGGIPPDQVIAHTNLYSQQTSAPGRTARTVNAAELEFDAPS